jgi:predicted RNase H-like nuclease (RuvC/YqgF family)
MRPSSHRKAGANMSDDTEIAWHREQITKNRTVVEELEAGNSAGSDVFSETQSEIDRLKAQITQSELIVAAYEKEHPGTP